MGNFIDLLAEKVAKQLTSGEKHDLPEGYSLTTNFMHGPSGIFGTVGAERDVFSTRVKPTGLLSVLPAIGTVDINPIQYYLTGFTAESGTEPSASCETCVKAGEIKSCRQGAVFGEICRETEPLDLSAVGQHVNRGEMYDLRLVNDPLLNSGDLWVPSSVPKSVQDVLNREAMARWLTLGVAFEEKLAKMVFTGNPANNNGTGYMEYFGLESLVTTGHADIISSVSCPSLDSMIYNLNYATVETSAPTIFNYLINMYRVAEENASSMGFNPVEFAFVMRLGLFRKLTEYWPCIYASSGCNATANDISNSVDGMAQKRFTDEMYTGRYLMIDGARVPVIVDDAVPTEINATNGNIPSGSFASDIYLLPFTVKGGRRVLFMEYFDYSAGGSMMQAVQDGNLTHQYWTDSGKFIWTTRVTDWCVIWKAKIKPRLRLLTPQLAGRLQNIVWSPLIPFREPFTDQGYFVDGGNKTGNNAPYDLIS